MSKNNKAVHSAQMVAWAACIAAQVPSIIEGDPGQGKTARLTQILTSWGRHAETIISSSREATDFLGIPVEKEGFIHYVPFAWVKRLNDALKGVVILDEFNLGSDGTMRAQLRMVQEGYVGDTPLGPNVCITAIMNPVESSAGAVDLMAPVSNRFIHLAWDFDAELWYDGIMNGFDNVHVPALADLISPHAVSQKIKLAAVMAEFHKTNGGIYLTPEVPTDVAAGKPWASPRSWSNALDALSFIPERNTAARLLILNGAVGESAQKAFTTFLDNFNLPNPEDVIANPAAFDWNSRFDIVMAVTRAIAAHVRLNVKSDPKIWGRAAEALAVCASNGKPDVAHAALQSMMKTRPKDALLSDAVINEFRGILSYLPNGVIQEPVAA